MGAHLNKACSVWLFLICTLAFSREPKENKRVYTYNLQRYLQLIDFSLDDRGLEQSLRAARLLEVKRLHEITSKKLSDKKKRLLDTLFELCFKEVESKERFKGCNRLRHSVMKVFRMIKAPAVTPNFALGKTLYQDKCISCHGSHGKGDGYFTQNKHFPMIPPPRSFRTQIRNSYRTPFSYFNSIMIGSTSTAMRAYSKELSVNEIWSLAFYISSMRGSPTSNLIQPPKNLTLSDISVYNNLELKDKFPQVKSLSFFRDVFPFDSQVGR